jgi:hypothetical protein
MWTSHGSERVYLDLWVEEGMILQDYLAGELNNRYAHPVNLRRKKEKKPPCLGEKFLEKVVSIRLCSFLEEEKILSKLQFGFRKSHSTVHAMVHFLNNISCNLNAKKHTVAIFCDLRKAFDTVDHSILLKKMYKMGIRNTELAWFKNYLSERKQFVSLDGKASSQYSYWGPSRLHSGAPSVLTLY